MKVFAPGPAQIDDEIREIISRQVVYHRSDYFLNIWNELHKNMKDIFETTSGEVLINNGSGTQGMDNVVLNLINKGEKVLVISTGFFGDRFTEINNKYKNNVIELNYEWGETYNIEDVKKVISEHSDLSAIFATHCDTSCGILNQLEPLGKLTKDTNMLLIVDSISGIIMNELKFDEWHLDAVVSASQKGFMLPPGLNMVCLSQKALDKLNNVDSRSYYNNFKDQLKYIENDYLFCTVNTPYLCALYEVTLRIKKHGLKYYNNYYNELYVYLEKELLELDFKLFLEGNYSNSLIVFTPPANIKSNELAKYLQDSNIIIGIGFARLDTKVNRIGIMNAITMDDCKEIIKLIKEYLCHMDTKMKTQ